MAFSNTFRDGTVVEVGLVVEIHSDGQLLFVEVERRRYAPAAGGNLGACYRITGRRQKIRGGGFGGRRRLPVDAIRSIANRQSSAYTRASYRPIARCPQHQRGSAASAATRRASAKCRNRSPSPSPSSTRPMPGAWAKKRSHPCATTADWRRMRW